MVETNTLPSPSLAEDRLSDSPSPGLVHRAFRASVLRRLESIQSGSFVVLEDGNTHHFGCPAAKAVLRARVEVLHPDTWRRVATGGTVGFAECWMDGLVTIDDPVALVRMFVRDRQAMDSFEGGMSKLSAPLRNLWHRMRRNTPTGSRRNIEAHYDLGNDFYKLWLDETMMYSSAIWQHPDQTLAEASTAKLERICRKLGLGPDMHVLEIGTGWGGFALHAASHHGCRVTTTTISREQHDLAVRRVAEAGLSHLVTVLDKDYRHLEGTYDRVVSIEMVEAVGWQFLGTYFERIGHLLKPEGAALIQAITIADRHYEAARNSVDFIQRHIFPGSFIPSLGVLVGAARDHSDLNAVHMEDIGTHYARTLKEWRERFLAAREQVRALGYSERFLRMWEWYLAYCEGGFLERQLGDAQILFAKPGWRGNPPLGTL